MYSELDDVNPKFVEWCEEHGVNTEYHEDWYPWLECWSDGYACGVNDVKEIIRGDKNDD